LVFRQYKLSFTYLKLEMQNRTFEEFIERELLGVINDSLGNKI